jgi:hypothetical protein
MAAADTGDTINCSFKLKEFWMPAAISIACGLVAVSLGLFFMMQGGGFMLGAWIYSAVNLCCSIPFFMIAMGYGRLLSGEYRMEITPQHIIWPLPNAESINPLTRRHVKVPNTDIHSISIISNSDGGRGLVLLVRKNGRRFLVGLPSLSMTPAQLAEMFNRHGYRTTVKITDEQGTVQRS